MRDLLGKTAITFIGLVSAQVLTATTYWVVARQLGPARFGPLMAVVGVGILLVSFSDLGLNQATMRSLARDFSDVAFYQEALGAKLFVSLLVVFGWLVVTVAAALLGRTPGEYVILGIYVGFTLLLRTALVPLYAAQAFGRTSLLMVIERSALFCVTASLLVLDLDDLAMPVGLALSSGVALVLTGRALPPHIRGVRRPSPRRLGELVRGSMSFAVEGSLSELQRLDVMLVQSISGRYSSGIYAGPARLAGTLSLLSTAFSNVLYPRVAASGRSTSGEIRRAGTLVVGGTALLLAGVFLLAGPIIETFLGPEYRSSVAVLRIVVVAVGISCLSHPLAAYLQGRGEERYVAWVVAGACTSGLLMVAVGAVIDGPAGAAWGSVMMQALLASLLARRVVRVLGPARADGWKPRP